MTQDTNTASGAAIQRYKIGYHADECGQRSSTPSGIPDASGSWVRYADHVTALAAGQATAAQAGVPANMRLCYSCGHPADAHPWVNDPRGGKRRGDCPAAPAQPAAPQGVAYAALPTSNYAGRVHEEGFLIGTCPLYTADQMRSFADATYMLRASRGQAPAGAAEEIDKALNVYAQAFAARVNGWTRQNGDDLPGARSALFAAIHAYAQASTRPTTSPQADNKKKTHYELPQQTQLPNSRTD